MKAGKVGILVIMISLAGMLGIGWFMSMDVVMTEKTVYNELTDITPLFGSEQAPEFTDYTPSTNYTGYYTDDSIINGTKYFAGVDYDSSARANTYALYSLEDVDVDQTVTLSTYSGTYPFTDPDTHITYVYMDPDTGFSRAHSCTTSTTVTLASYITAMNLDEATNVVTIRSVANPASTDSVFGQLAEVDWVLFSLTNYWKETGGANFVNFATPEWFEHRHGEPGYIDPANNMMYNPPIVACKADLDQQLVYFYLDKECTVQYGIFNLSDVIISYGGSGSNITNINFGDTADVFAASIVKSYMDPSKGVEMI